MQSRGFTVSAMHGDMDQSERKQSDRKFRSKETRVLITTDLGGRRNEFQRVPLVVNFDLSANRDIYLSRIGCNHTAISFALPGELDIIRDIESFYQTKIDDMPSPASALTLP